ncbi:hypothetical protein U1Q18_009967, partial [Sarracenia purpurea var. burkii]
MANKSGNNHLKGSGNRFHVLSNLKEEEVQTQSIPKPGRSVVEEALCIHINLEEFFKNNSKDTKITKTLQSKKESLESEVTEYTKCPDSLLPVRMATIEARIRHLKDLSPIKLDTTISLARYIKGAGVEKVLVEMENEENSREIAIFESRAQRNNIHPLVVSILGEEVRERRELTESVADMQQSLPPSVIKEFDRATKKKDEASDDLPVSTRVGKTDIDDKSIERLGDKGKTRVGDEDDSEGNEETDSDECTEEGEDSIKPQLEQTTNLTHIKRLAAIPISPKQATSFAPNQLNGSLSWAKIVASTEDQPGQTQRLNQRSSA